MKRLIVCSTREQQDSFLVKWLGGTTVLFWNAHTIETYDEIVILPYQYGAIKPRVDNPMPELELFNLMIENLKIYGARIIDLNTVNEGTNESQGTGGQADSGKPDAG